MSLTASGFSDYFENKVLNWFKGGAFPSAPTTVYVGLFTTNPADAGTLASPQDGTEMSTSNGSTGFSNYARVSITAASGWNAIAAATGDSTGQQITNNAQLPPSGTSWTNNGGSTVTISGIGIWDAATGTNLLFWFAITAQQVTTTNAFQINAAGLTVQAD